MMFTDNIQLADVQRIMTPHTQDIMWQREQQAMEAFKRARELAIKFKRDWIR